MRQLLGVLVALVLLLCGVQSADEEFMSLYDDLSVDSVESSWNNPTYNPTLALHYLYGAAAIQCSTASLNSWTCGKACGNLPGFTNYYIYRETVTMDGFTIPCAFAVFINDKTKEIFFSFRGTDGYDQLKDEFTNFIGLSYSTESWNVQGALVDKYFGLIYKNIFRDKVVNNLKALGKQYPTHTYTFMGHSLGGALATLAALDGVTIGAIPVKATTPQLYTYGSPRVGNWLFASSVSSLVPVMFRVVHFNDMVPHVPLCQGEPVTKCLNNNANAAPIWAWHVKQEIYYNKDNTSYKVCSETNSEDWSCSDSVSPIVWSAHDFYLGIYISQQCA